MSAELATTDDTTALALGTDQDQFTDRQIAALQHMGVDGATAGDLEVFFHRCKTSGLDPFSQQIHMVNRQGKWTIQTGIDGFRLIGRRAADAAGETIALDPPQWAHQEGGWRDVWSQQWGQPLAARITIYRDGQPFTAVAMFDEYAQTKRDGGLNSMWRQRPAGQLAKCAEALAWRMAFPQDLAGLYTDDEMGQADNPHRRERQSSGLATALNGHQDQPADDDQETTEGEVMLNPHSPLAKQLFASMNDAGITERDARLAWCSQITGREITSSSDLTETEARNVIDGLPQQPDGGE